MLPSKRFFVPLQRIITLIVLIHVFSFASGLPIVEKHLGPGPTADFRTDPNHPEDDWKQFRAASDFINNRGGYTTLILDDPDRTGMMDANGAPMDHRYYVGHEAPGTGDNHCHWVSEFILRLENCTNVTIHSANSQTPVIIKTNDGQHMGLFNPDGSSLPLVSGEPNSNYYNPFGDGCDNLVNYINSIVPYPQTNPANGSPQVFDCQHLSSLIDFVRRYMMAAPRHIFELLNCTNISLSDIELDGNNSKFVYGGQYSRGNPAFELGHTGILCSNTHSLTCTNMYVHDMGNDGLQISNGSLETDDLDDIHINYCKFNHNGRNGISWVGGNDLNMSHCEANYNAGPDADGVPSALRTSPGAGLDIEPEGYHTCIKGNFEYCYFIGNSGHGVAAGDNPDINWYVAPFNTVPPGKHKFDHCYIGATTSNSATGVVYAALVTQRATEFNHCEFYGYSSFFYRPQTGTQMLFENRMKFDDDIFTDCYHGNIISLGPASITNTTYIDSRQAEITNCKFKTYNPATKYTMVLGVTHVGTNPDDRMSISNCEFTKYNSGNAADPGHWAGRVLYSNFVDPDPDDGIAELSIFKIHKTGPQFCYWDVRFPAYVNYTYTTFLPSPSGDPNDYPPTECEMECVRPGNPVITADWQTSPGHAVLCSVGGQISMPVTLSGNSNGTWYLNGAPYIPIPQNGPVTSASIVVTTPGNYTIVVPPPSGCSSNVTATSSVMFTVTVQTVYAEPLALHIEHGNTCGGTVLASNYLAYFYKEPDEIHSINTYPGIPQTTLLVYDQGTYFVRITTACTDLHSDAITVGQTYPVPDASVEYSGSHVLCNNGSVTLMASEANAGYQWTWNHNNIPGATNPALNITTAGGVYNLVVTNEGGCSSTSPNITITANNNITAPEITRVDNIPIVGPIVICDQNGIELQSTASTGNQWFQNAGAISGQTNTSIIIDESGIYTVTAPDNSGCNSKPVTVVIGPPATPVITYDGDLTYCANLPTAFTSSSPSNNQWYVNDAPIQDATGQTFTYTRPGGPYKIKVVVDNGCDKGISDEVIVTVIEAPTTPVIDQTPPLNFCITNTPQYLSTASNANLTYQWYRNDLPMNGATGTTIEVYNGLSYVVRVANTLGCSANSAPAIVNFANNSINPPGIVLIYTSAPVPAPILVEGPIQLCQGESITLGSTAWNNNHWHKVGTPGDIGTGRTITISQTGEYYLTVTNTCGVSPQSNHVFVNPATTITPSGPTTFCSGESVVLTATGESGYTYLWFLNDNTTGLTSQSITVTSAGHYSVQITNNNGCVTTSDYINVVVNTTPVASVVPPGPLSFCQGTSVTLNANTGTGLSYAWSLNSNDLGLYTSSITVTTGGAYHVVITSSQGCTSAPATVLLDEFPQPAMPTISPAGPITTCSTTPQTLTASTITGVTYAWYLDGAPTGTTTQSIVASSAGTYTVKVTNSLGCSNTSTAVIVSINASPSATITASGPTTFCEGGSVTLSAPTGTGLTYLWSNGLTTSSINVISSGTYTVRVTNSQGCYAITSPGTTVTVNPLPVVSAGGPYPDLYTTSSAITLNGSPSGGTFSGTGVNGNNFDPAVSGAGSFVISYTYTNANGCTRTAQTTINVTVCSFSVASAITGSTNACASMGSSNSNTNMSYSITATNASGYTWTVPGSGGQNPTATFTGQGTATIVVDYLPGFTGGTLSVVVTSACTANTSTTVNLSINANAPAVPGSITGPTNACLYLSPYDATDAQYSISAVANATSYTWGITSGMGTITSTNPTSGTTATVHYTNAQTGSVNVIASNFCGSSAQQVLGIVKNLAVKPANLTGPVDICTYMSTNPPSQVAYSVDPNSNNNVFTWSLVNSSNVTQNVTFNGQNTPSVTFAYPSGFTSGTLSVVGVNGCGTSGVTKISVDVNPPSIVTGGLTIDNPSICPTVNRTFTTPQVSNYTYQWQYTPQPQISHTDPGSIYQNSIVLQFNAANGTDAAFSTGTVKVRAVNGCGTSGFRTLAVSANCSRMASNNSLNNNLQVSETESSVNNQGSLYPNPSNGDFKIILGNKLNSSAAVVMISNSFGETVYNASVKCNNGSIMMNLHNKLIPGVYTVTAIVNGEKTTRKLVIKN